MLQESKKRACCGGPGEPASAFKSGLAVFLQGTLAQPWERCFS